MGPILIIVSSMNCRSATLASPVRTTSLLKTSVTFEMACVLAPTTPSTLFLVAVAFPILGSCANELVDCTTTNAVSAQAEIHRRFGMGRPSLNFLFDKTTFCSGANLGGWSYLEQLT